jgi:hypothetical protein
VELIQSVYGRRLSETKGCCCGEVIIKSATSKAKLFVDFRGYIEIYKTKRRSVAKQLLEEFAERAKAMLA